MHHETRTHTKEPAKPQEVLPVNTKAKDTFLRQYTPPEERQGSFASFLLGMEGKGDNRSVMCVQYFLGTEKMICLL